MKPISLLVAGMLLICNIISAQIVAKLPVPNSKADTLVDPQITQVNKLINQYNLKKSVGSLEQLKEFLKKNTLDSTKPFFAKGDSLLLKIYAKGADTVSLRLFDETAPEVKKESCHGVNEVTDLKVEKNDDGEYLVSLVDKAENPLNTFRLKQFNEELFWDAIAKMYYGLCNEGTVDSNKIIAAISEMQKVGLYKRMLEASLEVHDDDVPSGELRVFKSVPVRLVKSNIVPIRKEQDVRSKTMILNSNGPYGELAENLTMDLSGEVASARVPRKRSAEETVMENFTVHEIQIQFQDGFIENIKVLGKIEGIPKLLKFENFYPLAFSTRRDFRKLYNIRIYERTVFSKESFIVNGYHGPVSIRLGDLIFYSQNLDIDTKDYSPYNHVFKSTITGDVTIVNLYKEKTSKILEMKVYTDVKGIEGDDPNGLVQFELAKKLNFWNNRVPVSRSSNLFNVGFLNSMTAFFTMNKIEKNNRRLVLGYLGTRRKDTMQANNFASTLSLLQYQAYTLGVNFNIFTFDVPGFKSTLCINTGLYFGRTPVQDTLRVKFDSAGFKPIEANNVIEYGVNNLQIAPEFCWQIFPDKRFGLSFSQRFIHFRMQSDRLKQIKDSVHYATYLKSLNGNRAGIDDYTFRTWLGSAELFAFYRPSEYNKIFFRYRFNWDLDNIRQNFHQMQLGVSTYLTNTKKDKRQQNE